MTPHFFIKRPVFAWVIALIIGLGGVLALNDLAIEQYPSIAPPSLSISVTYPGADASVLETNVTQIIEQELNGVEGFLYMQATSRSNGSASIDLTFESGTDIDNAQMEVQNRLSRVEQRLPEEVRRQGVQVNQASSNFLMIVALTSKNGETSALELGNFASAQVVDELRRVPGVGDITEFSTEYAMRVWLDPDKLANFNLSPAEVLAAVQEQNSQSAGGALGDLPNAENVEITASIQTQGRMSTPEEFSQIILRANSDGSTVRLSDVARVELGAESYLTRVEINEQETAGMAVQLTPGANALEVSEGIKSRMVELERGFPEDIGWIAPYDSTPFISASIKEVVVTLSVAMVLVFLVMFVFLQSWRATVIPTIVVPIALAGACLGLWLFGFSINLLSLFAMILAIGTLVDDAIVVVENVERLMEEEDLSPYRATVKAMDQVTSAVIGTTLVLIAVFLPMAFFPGSTGGIYRQFSVTLAISVAVSTILALSLTPALCAALLRPPAREGERPPLGKRVFAPFNRFIDRTTAHYQGGVGGILVRPLRFLLVFVALVFIAGLLFLRLPGSLIPAEDQGSMLTAVQGPSGSTADRTDVVVDQVKAYYDELPQVENVVFIHGFSFFGQGQAHAMSFVTLLPWGERPGVENSAQTLVQNAMGALSTIRDASVFVLNPPSIPSLGVAGGFSFKLQDRSGAGPEALMAARDQLLGAASQSELLTGVRPEGEETAPRLRVDVDRIKARALGLSISDIDATLSITFGSAYANDFSREGRIHRVLLQADAPFRMTPEDVLDLTVRTEDGDIVPFGAFTSVAWTAGPPQLQRYNGYPATTISGNAAPGRSSGEAMDEMERLAAELPEGFGFEWTGLSYEEQQASGQVGALMGLSILIVLLVLAALYESWTIPVAVLLVVPLGVLGAVLFSMTRGLPADVYFNVGLITVIGLSAKNAILIVEFAIEEESKGKSLMDATMAAVKLRLRPILMTSLTFILGMLPLVVATGPGAASRIAVGTGVMGGMLMATVLGVFFTPLFYLAVRRWLTRKKPPGAESDEDESGSTDVQEPRHA
ncbi:multidrug efflux RND transporter permease subunit [Halopseudomonas pelagia]|uniref:Efflux pump membrane transporter n=1 Tax=Halopseudomonas pelagia TaxID=553151 RepID=A0AA91U2Q1_9GAMM|nr:multidrug efflux RND transporter permease subunit [Halopseudomonas pelagia]PCC99457.1 hydrophobe/amphiphile efflux-1 family RND transporter [Halopseudomonas pelagia]QFY56459.1 multidrug efflux RND transporter permease subunit [Halopseudomonas pelagia]